MPQPTLEGPPGHHRPVRRPPDPRRGRRPLRHPPRLGLQAQGPLRGRGRDRARAPIPAPQDLPDRASGRGGRPDRADSARSSTDAGLDAGPETIAWHLEHHHGHRVARSTISRHLTAAGLVTPEPKKRPKSSYIRFQARCPTRPGSPTSPTTGSPTPTADPAPTWRSSPGSTTAPATPCTCPPTPGSPPRSSSRPSGKPLPGTGSRHPRSPTTAWSTPSDWPGTDAREARTPSKPSSVAATSSRRTPDPVTPPPAGRPNASSRR